MLFDWHYNLKDLFSSKICQLNVFTFLNIRCLNHAVRRLCLCNTLKRNFIKKLGCLESQECVISDWLTGINKPNVAWHVVTGLDRLTVVWHVGYWT